MNENRRINFIIITFFINKGALLIFQYASPSKLRDGNTKRSDSDATKNKLKEKIVM